LKSTATIDLAVVARAATGLVAFESFEHSCQLI
jgi:hypothetical protein